MTPFRHSYASTQLGVASLYCIAQRLSLASKTVSLHVSCSQLSSGQTEPAYSQLSWDMPVPPAHVRNQQPPVVLLAPAWRCFVSAQAGRQLNPSHLHQCLWLYHCFLQQDGNPQAHIVIIWCLKIMGSFLFGFLVLLLNVVNVGNLISCLNDFHGCTQHPVMALPLYERLSCHC